MNHKLVILGCLAAIVTGCSNPEVKQAEVFYNNAKSAFDAGNYTEASALLDSIEQTCKTAIEWRKAGHELSYSVQLAQQEDSLLTANNMLEAITQMINETIDSGKFVFEKGEYDELGHYYVKGSDSNSNLGRSYLHAKTDEYGHTQLISEYRGTSFINHTQLRLIGSDGTQVETQVIPLTSEGANYHFKNQDVCHETVTFTDDPALSFIDIQVHDAKLKAILLYNDASKTFPILFNETDRKSIAVTYQLGKMLAAQLLYTQKSKTAGMKIQYLKSKMTTTQSSQQPHE